MKKYTFAVLNPGHFHAALSLRESHEHISDDVYVYSNPGPDLDTFVGFINDFNSRNSNPTNWKLHLKTEGNLLEALIEEKRADVVILAGRNNIKMEYIESLNKSGFRIFTDKPILTDENDLPLLNSAFSAERPLSLDIMTEREEVTTLLQKKFIGEPDVFGSVLVPDDGSPSIFKESVHHLYKLVNQKPLKRPSWYFDVNIQGEGILDVMTHLVDMSNWMLFPGDKFEYEEDFVLEQARRWPTAVSLDKYRAITGVKKFLETVTDNVQDAHLMYYCNGEIRYTLKGIPIHTRVIWNVQAPEGGGDTHQSLVRGTLSDLKVRQIPESGFKTEFLICPHNNSDSFAGKIVATLAKWQNELPGLSITPEGKDFIINIPDELRTTHEEHFCEVRDNYMDMLVNNKEPVNSRSNIIAKYTLLAEAKKLALTSEPVPLEMDEKKEKV